MSVVEREREKDTICASIYPLLLYGKVRQMLILHISAS